MAAIIEKKGNEKFTGDVKKEDGTTVQEEQTRDTYGAIDGAITKVDDLTVKLKLSRPTSPSSPPSSTTPRSSCTAASTRPAPT